MNQVESNKMVSYSSVYNPPTCKDVLPKALLQFICLLLLLLPMAYIYVLTANFEPFHRGFYCDDQNLKHPYMPQQVPISLCIVIWAAISIFTIVLVETLRSLAEKGRDKPIARSRTPWIAVELYRHFGYFSLGAISCLLFTEIAKYTIGRLRPHFLTVCNPEFTSQLCQDGSEMNYEKFVVEDENIICRGLVENGGNYTKKHLHEARLSFLSGHSSFSFFCATFVVVYLQSRLANFPKSDNLVIKGVYRFLKVVRPFAQFGLIMLAFWISLTRISDYFHHPLDVLTGAGVGIIFACVTLVVCADIFNKRSVFWTNFDRLGEQIKVQGSQNNPEKKTAQNQGFRRERGNSNKRTETERGVILHQLSQFPRSHFLALAVPEDTADDSMDSCSESRPGSRDTNLRPLTGIKYS